MKDTKIVSAFPACGKSYFHNKYNNSVLTTLDSDSSKFSWLLDSEGNSTGVRNPEFPANYVDHIKSNIGIVDVIFVSSHDEVKRALEEHGLKYILVMPDPRLMQEWIGRCWLRGSPDSFLNLLHTNWSMWVDPYLEDKWHPTELIWLRSGHYLSDVL